MVIDEVDAMQLIFFTLTSRDFNQRSFQKTFQISQIIKIPFS